MWINFVLILQLRNQRKLMELGTLSWYQLNPLYNQSLVTKLRQDNFVAQLEHAILQIDIHPHGEGEECNIVNPEQYLELLTSTCIIFDIVIVTWYCIVLVTLSLLVLFVYYLNPDFVCITCSVLCGINL